MLRTTEALFSQRNEFRLWYWLLTECWEHESVGDVVVAMEEVVVMVVMKQMCCKADLVRILRLRMQ